MRMKYLALALIPTLLVVLVVGTASAARLSISRRDFELRWTPLTLSDGAIEGECDVVLQGSFHSSTIRKIRDALIGHITKADATRVEPACTGAEIFMLNGAEELNGRRVANTLPWHVQYMAFSGALPNIHMEIGIVGASILIELPLVFGNCLFRSTAASPWRGILERNFTNGRIIHFRNRETSPIPIAAGQEILCPTEIFPERSAAVNVLNTTTSIILSLI